MELPDFLGKVTVCVALREAFGLGGEKHSVQPGSATKAEAG
jgi:hypothetical protein